nr:MAG TPA: hypothetical protein [Caudoviricetes sp.]DAO18542.1 MAG TPA: hypothetical protein [Caudoviricetes sp.]
MARINEVRGYSDVAMERCEPYQGCDANYCNDRK